MARRRTAEHDWICRRCLCICDPAGTRHEGGGPGMKACGLPPLPVLRSEHSSEIAAEVRGLLARRALSDRPYRARESGGEVGK